MGRIMLKHRCCLNSIVKGFNGVYMPKTNMEATWGFEGDAWIAITCDSPPCTTPGWTLWQRTNKIAFAPQRESKCPVFSWEDAAGARIPGISLLAL